MQGWGKKQAKNYYAFIVNAAGKSEVKPIVIWKAENPCCFKGVKKIDLLVEYYSQPKAWITGDTLQRVLSKLNR